VEGKDKGNDGIKVQCGVLNLGTRRRTTKRSILAKMALRAHFHKNAPFHGFYLSSFSVQEDEKESKKETEKETKRRTLNDANGSDLSGTGDVCINIMSATTLRADSDPPLPSLPSLICTCVSLWNFGAMNERRRKCGEKQAWLGPESNRLCLHQR
jgi:hypothetical protein